jgi:hypothetical protein
MENIVEYVFGWWDSKGIWDSNGIVMGYIYMGKL